MYPNVLMMALGYSILSETLKTSMNLKNKNSMKFACKI